MDREQQAFPSPEDQTKGWLPALLLLLALPVVGFLMLVLIGVGWWTYTLLMPVASAKTFIPELKASVTLELYYTHRDRDSGEYLIVDSPYGRVAGKIGGVMEWTHWSRTSLYLTEDHKLAVLGTAYEDYIVDLSKLTISDLAGRVASERWTYLGVFDGGSALRFIPASKQRECNATAMHQEEPYSWAARPQSRQEWCHNAELEIK